MTLNLQAKLVMKTKVGVLIIFLLASLNSFSQEKETVTKAQYEALLKRVKRLESLKFKEKAKKQKNRLQIGGYGEAVFSRRFYSDSWQRYSSPDLYKSGNEHGRVDIPHFVVLMNYDFGKGWTFSTEIEFEHAGVGAAREIEEEETGEYETEIEKGGEIVLEQFWVQKSFNKALNVRMGHIVVPVGGTNVRHLPIEFFGNYRPEGESKMLPSTWHQTGISIWGKKGNWRYEAQLLPGLDAYLFDDNYWIAKGATSPFEFKIANTLAGMLRIDNYSIKGLQLGLSTYMGKSGLNSLKQDNYEDIDGLVSVIAFDFNYNNYNWVVRGSADYGNLTDSDKITVANMRNRKDSPSPKDKVAKSALNLWAEAGYNLFALSNSAKYKKQKLYVFGRYNYYDTMYKTEETIVDDPRFERNCYAFGINYYPIQQIVLKAEFTSRNFNEPYNTENAVNIGVAFSGFFLK